MWRYTLYALIDPASSGQTGPEFSTQNTRRIAPGQFRTHTAGIQYVSNPFLAVGGQQPFKIWVEVSPGQASWQDFSLPLRLTLATATWIKFTLDVNYDLNEYVAFSMRSADGSVNVTHSLTGVRMAEEAKGFTNEAFVITTEAQNRYDCGSTTVHQNKVFYDALSLGVVSSLSFTDDPIMPAVTTAMAVHVTELRSRIDTARQRCGTSSYSWDATPTPAVTPVRALHVIEMRTALSEAYASCGRTAPTYTDEIVAGSTPIRAVHLAELRNAVAYLE